MKFSIIIIVCLALPWVSHGQNTSPWPANGNIGIGTTSPDFLLQVHSSNFPTIAIGKGNSNTNGKSSLFFNAGVAGFANGFWINYFKTASTDRLGFVDGGAVERVSILNGGNVGIGTISPETLFNINQGAGNSVTGTPALRIGGTSNYPSLEFGIKGAYDGMISTYGNDLHIYAGNWRSAGATATENHNISFYTSQTSSTNWNTPKMYLRYDGNLGIGSVNPGAKFSLRTSTSTQGIIISNCDAVGYQSHFGLTTADHSTIGTASESYLNYYNDGKWNLNSSNTNGTTLPIAFSTDGTTRLFIKPDGNVGIGTTAPDAKLAVKGTIHTQEVRVDLNGAVAPDYVFEKDYNLMPLDELKVYLEANKHLPEVPSAQEMDAHGVNLKEMNLLLLKKVEELTLYQIQSIDRIQKLEKEIETLKKKTNE